MKFRISFEVRRCGAIGEFSWGVGVDVVADDKREAIEQARQEINANGFETRGVRILEVRP